jgi:hypothetical protein
MIISELRTLLPVQARVACVALLLLVAGTLTAGATTMRSGPADAVIGRPDRTVLAADAGRTVVQITFPVTVAPRDWHAVRTVDWTGIITDYLDPETEEIVPVEAMYSYHVAVAGRAAPTWRVAAVQWYREPVDPTAPVVTVRPPDVYRGVSLALAQVFPEAGGGILAGLVLEVQHPSPPDLKRAADDPLAGRRAASERPPSSVINPEHYRDLRALSVARALLADRKDNGLPDWFALSDNWVKLEVTALGIHAVRGQDLELLGLDLGVVDPATIRVYKGGGFELANNPELPDLQQASRMGLTEIPIRVEGEHTGEFEAHHRVIFYGFGTDVWRDRLDPAADRLAFYNHLMQNRGVYWLTWQNVGEASPLPGIASRVAVVDAAPTGGEVVTTHRARYHGEENLVYLGGFVRDRWVWQSLINAAFNPQATLHGVVPDTETYWQVDICGMSLNSAQIRNNIRTSIWLNNDQANAVTVTWQQFDQLNQEQFRISGTSHALVSGANTVRLLYENYNQARVYLAFDSFDLLYDASLVKTEYPGTLTSVFWGDEITTPGTLHDVRYTLPASGDLQVWDVSDPTAAVELQGSLQAGTPRTLTVGLVREPAQDRHLVLFAGTDPLPVVRATLASIRPLRATVPAADYVVIHPAAFGEAAANLASLRSRVLPGVASPVALAIDIEDIYANFSGGQKDWRAIRNFLRWHWDTHGERLRWVCLLGDASRDYRNNLNRNPAAELVDWIPTDVIANFPSGFPYPLSMLNHPYAADGSLVGLDDPAGATGGVDIADIAVGRLSANSPAGALALVERMRAYSEDPPEGPWRNRVTFCADDLKQNPEDNRQEYWHTDQAENLTNNYLPRALDLGKVYLVDYPYVGRYKPAARRDLLSLLDAGTTIFYYVGHGAANVLADEQVFLSDFIPGLTNAGRRFFFAAFSCDVGVFDDPGAQCMAEQFLEPAQGGGIAAVAASWVSIVSSNDALSSAFFAALYPERRVQPTVTLGEALIDGKAAVWTSLFNVRNTHRYNLIGDPALSLPHPVDDLVFTADTADSLLTGTLHTVGVDLNAAGFGLKAGQQYQLLVQESAVAVNYHTVYDWQRLGNPVFRGSGGLTDDQAQIDFLAPLNLRLGEAGRLRLIVSDGDERDRSAVLQVPVVQAAVETGHDLEGPRIRLAFAGNRTRVQPGAQLVATLQDTSGINILASNPANSVLLEFDGSGIYNNVSDNVVFAPGSYTRATMTTVLPADLELGPHKVVMTASDMFGNVGSDTLQFFLEAGGVAAMRDATVFPNPTRGPCRLICEISGPMDLRWDIYTVSGRRVRSVRESFSAAGPAILQWDGRDGEGDEIANGVYLYVLRGTMPGAGHEIRETGQVVIMR